MPMKIMKKVIRTSVAPWYMIWSGLNFPAKSISPNIIAVIFTNEQYTNENYRDIKFSNLKLLVKKGKDFHVQIQEQEDESPMKMQQ